MQGIRAFLSRPTAASYTELGQHDPKPPDAGSDDLAVLRGKLGAGRTVWCDWLSDLLKDESIPAAARDSCIEGLREIVAHSGAHNPSPYQRGILILQLAAFKMNLEDARLLATDPEATPERMKQRIADLHSNLGLSVNCELADQQAFSDFAKALQDSRSPLKIRNAYLCGMEVQVFKKWGVRAPGHPPAAAAHFLTAYAACVREAGLDVMPISSCTFDGREIKLMRRGDIALRSPYKFTALFGPRPQGAIPDWDSFLPGSKNPPELWGVGRRQIVNSVYGTIEGHEYSLAVAGSKGLKLIELGDLELLSRMIRKGLGSRVPDRIWNAVLDQCVNRALERGQLIEESPRTLRALRTAGSPAAALAMLRDPKIMKKPWPPAEPSWTPWARPARNERAFDARAHAQGLPSLASSSAAPMDLLTGTEGLSMPEMAMVLEPEPFHGVAEWATIEAETIEAPTGSGAVADSDAEQWLRKLMDPALNVPEHMGPAAATSNRGLRKEALLE